MFRCFIRHTGEFAKSWRKGPLKATRESEHYPDNLPYHSVCLRLFLLCVLEARGSSLETCTDTIDGFVVVRKLLIKFGLPELVEICCLLMDILRLLMFLQIRFALLQIGQARLCRVG